MSKKIIVLNGAPRKKGNTAELINEFTKGAEKVGNTVIRFNLQEMNIHPCLGCYGGGKDPESPCVQKDDMDQIYSVYREADMVVLASPMYYWDFSGQLKCAFDRLFAVAECDPNYTNPVKDCILLVAADSDIKKDFEPFLNHYKALLSQLKWKDCGIIIAGGNMKIDDIQKRPEQLEEARKLGASIK